MAFAAGVPFSIVVPGIDREIESVMLPEIGGFPARFRGMAFGTAGGKPSPDVVGHFGVEKIRLMAGITIRRGRGVITVLVACIAILDGMPLGQREEGVVEIGTGPCKGVHLVAFAAIGGKAGKNVIGAGGGLIVGAMTVVTFHSQRLKLEQGGGGVAIEADGGGVGSQQWKATQLVDGGDVVDQPGFGGVAAGTFESQGLFMDVCMARKTLRPGLGKYQGGMAQPAGDHVVLPLQHKPGGVVVPQKDFFVDFPSFGGMAIGTADLQVSPMR